MEFLEQSTGRKLSVSATDAIGKGGEAAVYALPDDPARVAKIYHAHKQAKIPREKLRIMLANPPEDPMAAEGEISIAWPADLLETPDASRSVVGLLLPRISDRAPIVDYYHPQTRRKRYPLFTYQYLLRAARNLAAAVRALHAKGIVIGDVNESNILVSDNALVTLIDTDSFQIRDPEAGTVYRCLVGRPEFTPPELQGTWYADSDRTPEQDRFGLAVILFKLLMEGTHPFDGVIEGDETLASLDSRIRAGAFPHTDTTGRNTAKPGAPPFEILAPEIQRLFLRCFADGHANPSARPDALTWQRALIGAEEALVTCARNDRHLYGQHLAACPWCLRTEQLHGLDPFPSAASVQAGTHLKGVSLAQVRLPAAGLAAPSLVPPAPKPDPAPLAAPSSGMNRRAFLLLGSLAGLGAVLIWRAVSTPSPKFLPALGTKTNLKDGAEMIFLPEGEFLMGSKEGDPMNRPQRTVYLDGYAIYKNPVTVAQYRKFCEETGRQMPGAPAWGWLDAHPVVNVTWIDANAYADWAGMRLPTEAQWEKAARGTDGREYPWGNDWDASRCSNSVAVKQTSTSAVNSFPSGASPYVILDMAGNVSQWCADYFDANYYGSGHDRNPTGPAKGDIHVIRGAAWDDDRQLRFPSWYRNFSGPDDSTTNLGFRCVEPGNISAKR